MDLRQQEFFIFYLLLELVISPLDVLGPGVVGCVLGEVDGAVESEFLLPDP